MKLKLPDSVSSPQDLQAVTLEVREYARWFNQNTIKKQLKVKRASEPPVVSEPTSLLIREWSSKQPLSQQSLDQLIEQLKELARTAPTMNITLAAPPTGSLKQTLVGWCRQNVAPDILVSFGFNSTLLGGMVVRYGSKIFDWSFRQRILAEHEHFSEVLRNV